MASTSSRLALDCASVVYTGPQTCILFGEWIIPSGEIALFEEGGERIKVRPRYKIKVGDDWGWVDVGQVGEFHNGIWYVRVRDVWRATHGRRPGVPDWKQ